MTRRTLKSELQKAFTDEITQLERILYFYCHGSGAGNYGETSLEEAKLSLTDGFVSAADIHRVRHEGADPAVTLHVYSPPLLQMGAYAVGSDGVLVRHAMSSSEELRPAAAA